MTGLDTVRAAVLGLLAQQGIKAMEAYPDGPRSRCTEPTVALAMKAAQGRGAGLCHYLGERYNPESLEWEEIYGRQLQVVFSLDLYTPRSIQYGATACSDLFEQVAQVLLEGAPAGLKFGDFSCAEVALDRTLNLFHCRAEVSCMAYLFATVTDGGQLLDFKLKGVMKQ